MFGSLMFIPPNGLFLLFLIGFPLGNLLSSAWDTLGDNSILEGGRRRWTCAIDLEGCHVRNFDDEILFLRDLN